MFTSVVSVQIEMKFDCLQEGKNAISRLRAKPRLDGELH